jgi:uncharacterized membrane protein
MSAQHDQPIETIDQAAVSALSEAERASRGAGQESANPGAPAARSGGRVVVVWLPPDAAAPHDSAAAGAAASQRGAVHVAPNLRDLVAASATPQAAPATKARRDLNAVVHGVLIVGLAISTALMLAGVGLDLFYQRELPTAVPNIGDVVSRALALRPSGFLALGLLVLIATPILRVIGSLGAFVYERDWGFAGITALVFVILTISVLLGRG